MRVLVEFLPFPDRQGRDSGEPDRSKKDTRVATAIAPGPWWLARPP